MLPSPVANRPNPSIMLHYTIIHVNIQLDQNLVHIRFSSVCCVHSDSIRIYRSIPHVRKNINPVRNRPSLFDHYTRRLLLAYKR